MSALGIVIVSYNNAEVLLRCLAAAKPVADELGAQLIVVDNDSPDGSADRVAQEFPEVRLHRRPNLGFAAGVNWGTSSTPAQRILLLNPDCFLEREALLRCVATLDADPRIAAVSCRVVDEDGHPNLPCRAFPTLRQYFLERMGWDAPYPVLPTPPAPVDVDTVTGAFFLLSRRAWYDVGPFDEGFFLYGEETDWCWRAKKRGWRIVHDPRATVVHLGGQSTGTNREEPIGKKGLMLKTYLDSRERWWRKCYGPFQTWVMRGTSIAVAAIGLLAAGASALFPSGRIRARHRIAVEWFRIRHALHLPPSSRTRS